MSSYVSNSYGRSSVVRRHEGRHHFSFSLIIGDPFALSTISIAIVGWIIGLAGSIAVVPTNTKMPTLTWWGIVFQFFIILGIIVIVGFDCLYPYQLALISFLAVAVVYTTNTTNTFVWDNTPAAGAVAAGHILLSIINILWIFYFGTSSDERLHALIDSFSVNGNVVTSGPGTFEYSRSFPRQSGNPFERDEAINMTYTKQSNDKPAPAPADSYPQMFTSAQLGAFENSSENKTRDGTSYNSRLSVGETGATASDAANTRTDYDTGAERSELSSPIVYPYKATARYSYEANPGDSTELSFVKGEVLEISDIVGLWWQARRANGQVGICPSNYVQLEGNVENHDG